MGDFLRCFIHQGLYLKKTEMATKKDFFAAATQKGTQICVAIALFCWISPVFSGFPQASGGAADKTAGRGSMAVIWRQLFGKVQAKRTKGAVADILILAMEVTSCVIRIPTKKQEVTRFSEKRKNP